MYLLMALGARLLLHAIYWAVFERARPVATGLVTMSRDFDWPEFLFLLGALRWTVVLSLIAFVGGGIGGLVLAVARTSSHAILRWLAATYIGLMQGTPVLMQLFLAYYGLAVLTGIRIDPWPAVTLAFTMYAAAFLGEIWRGAIQAIPRQQWEAAAALPLAPAAQLRLRDPAAGVSHRDPADGRLSGAARSRARRSRRSSASSS